MPIGTIRDLGAEGKTVLLRLDLNSPIDPTSNLILDDKRFREHLPTIRALEKSRVVIVTHQSRPGKKDFTTLEAHAEKLEQLLGKPVLYVDSIFGSHAREAVHAMKPGEVIDARECPVQCRREPDPETGRSQKDASGEETLLHGGCVCQRRLWHCPPLAAASRAPSRPRAGWCWPIAASRWRPCTPAGAAARRTACTMWAWIRAMRTLTIPCAANGAGGIQSTGKAPSARARRRPSRAMSGEGLRRRGSGDGARSRAATLRPRRRARAGGWKATAWATAWACARWAQSAWRPRAPVFARFSPITIPIQS